MVGSIPESIGPADRTLAGREISSGRLVTIHLLAGGHNAANDALLAQIVSLPPDYQACFLETGDYYGTLYVITDVLAGNPPLRQWLAGLKAKIAAEQAARPNDLLTRVRTGQVQTNVPQPAVHATPPPRPIDEPGEFTRLLRAQTGPPSPPAETNRLIRATPKPPVQAASVAPAAPATGEAGEFTRLLRAEAKPPAAATPAPQSTPQATSELGEFTRLLRAEISSSPRAAPPAEPAAPPPSQPSEFTRMMGGQPNPRSAPAPSSPLQAAEPGEFTRMLQSPLAPAAQGGKAAPPPMLRRLGGRRSRAGRVHPHAEFAIRAAGFGWAAAGGPSAARNPVATPRARFRRRRSAGSQGRPRKQGPSEFTKMFKAPAPAPPAPAAPKAARKPAPAAHPQKENELPAVRILIGWPYCCCSSLLIYMIFK